MTAPWGGTEVAQVGIVATGILNILVGVVIRYLGKERLDKVLPPAVTGSVAIVIGIALSKEALDMATAQCPRPPSRWAGPPAPSSNNPSFKRA